MTAMNNKPLIVAGSVLMLLVLSVASVDLTRANPQPYSSFGSDNIRISILSPEDKTTYETGTIQLTVTVAANPGIISVEYSLDGGQPIRLTSENWGLGHTFNISIWLDGLVLGSHNLLAKATTFAQSPVGILTACSQVTFVVDTNQKPTSTPSIKPTTTSTASPIPSPSIPELPPWTIALLLLAIIALFVLLTLKKRRIITLQN
jgi:hypothetical protein